MKIPSAYYIKEKTIIKIEEYNDSIHFGHLFCPNYEKKRCRAKLHTRKRKKLFFATHPSNDNGKNPMHIKGCEFRRSNPKIKIQTEKKRKKVITQKIKKKYSVL